MYDFKQDLIKRYKQNIAAAECELKGVFNEVYRLKRIIAENKVMLNSLEVTQLSFTDLLKDYENKEILKCQL